MTVPESPVSVLRRTATLMRERADAMEREMSDPENPYWRCATGATPDENYRAGVSNGLGGASGEMAAAWDLSANRAVADWLDVEAAIAERRLPDDSGIIHAVLRIACAYLGEADGLTRASAPGSKNQGPS